MPKAVDLCQAGLKYLGTPYSRMDCQVFVERSLQDVGIDWNLSGSNAWYRAMTWTGTPAECNASFGAIPKGAFLFVLKQDGKEPEKYKPDGVGNASHIGIYTGMTGDEMCKLAGEMFQIPDALNYDFGDGALNSSNTHGCVCTSKFSGKAISGGWNRIGLWDRLSYDINFPGGGNKVTATVWAESGATVNMRSKPNQTAPLVDQVPIGSTVTVTSEQGEWDAITYKGKKGYIMSKFLILGSVQPGQDDQGNDNITVSRARLQAVYDDIGAMLR